MKTVITVAISGKTFTIEQDAYEMLKKYLTAFREKSSLGIQPQSVMADVEARLSDIFSAQLGGIRDVVDTEMVGGAIAQLGMPDGTMYTPDESFENYGRSSSIAEPQRRKLYRDLSNGSLGGVCAGLGHYFNIDKVIFRVAFVLLFFAGLSGLPIYIISWIVIPKAVTPKEKCEMMGLPLTPENISKFSTAYGRN